MTDLQELDRAECLRLLSANRFGRLAVVIGGAPTIRPVNYVYDEPSDSVIFRTAKGSKLKALLAAHKAAFELDGVDLRSRTGWSVVVRGAVEEIVAPTELRRLERIPLDPWAPGEKPHWIRLRVWTVTGRRIAEPEALPARGPAAARPPAANPLAADQ